MASLSLTKAEMDAIRFAADWVDTLREGAEDADGWPMEALGRVREKMKEAARRERVRAIVKRTLRARRSSRTAPFPRAPAGRFPA